MNQLFLANIDTAIVQQIKANNNHVMALMKRFSLREGTKVTERYTHQ